MTLSTIAIIFLISDFRLLRIVTFFISIILIIFITFSNSKIKERNIDHTLKQIGISENSQDMNIFSPEHDSLIRTAINMFLEKPVSGQGPNMFRKLCDKDKYSHNEQSCNTHPHNNQIQLLAETGVIGLSHLFIFLIFIITDIMKYLFFYYFRNQKIISNTQICIYISIFLTMWPLFPTLNFFTNWINVVYYLPLGFFLYFRYSKI